MLYIKKNANALKIYTFHGHLIKKQWIMSQILFL